MDRPEYRDIVGVLEIHKTSIQQSKGFLSEARLSMRHGFAS
jgi:hypothetical protein